MVGTRANPGSSLRREQAMSPVTVGSTPTTDGWECAVTLREGCELRYRVRVSRTDLARLAPGATDPEALVRASFRFLLEREPPEAILPSFDLPLIGHYYPEYEREIEERVEREGPR